MIVFIDIETVPTEDEEIIKAFEDSITAPAQYKKPESIAEWMVENKDAAVKELIRKTSFDALYGRIVCIGLAFDDEPPMAIYGDDEKDLLQRLNDEISGHTGFGSPRGFVDSFCGHNIHGFDLPFLKQRSFIKNVRPHHKLIQAMDAKPWADIVFDTMLKWSPERDKKVSMDKLCKALGIDGKGDMDGSMVAETWKVDKEKVAEYCKDDVHKVRQIYRRLTFAGE